MGERYMKRILPAIIILMLMVSVGYGEDQPLQLIIKSDKNVYEVGDEIEFLLEFINRSDKNSYIYLDEFYNAELFSIVDTEGNYKAIEQKVKYDLMWTKEGYKLIKEADRYRWNVKASIQDSSNPLIDFGDSLIKLERLGKFNITANYRGWDGITVDDDGQEISVSGYLGLKDAFVSTLTSNTITIEVVEKK